MIKKKGSLKSGELIFSRTGKNTGIIGAINLLIIKKLTNLDFGKVSALAYHQSIKKIIKIMGEFK